MAVIVTVDNHPNGVLPSERLIDLEYFKTPPGIVKIVQLVLGIVLVCYPYTSFWLEVVAYICFFLTFSLVWIYFFSLNKKYQSPNTPWPVLEFYYTSGATFAFGISTILTLLFLNIVAMIFGLLNTIAYAAGAFFLLNDWKEWKAQNAGMQSMQGH